MSVERDQSQKAEAGAFVKELLRMGEWSNDVDLARAAGVHPTGLSNYKNAVSMPEGYNLLRLIAATAARIDRDPVDVAATAVRAIATEGVDGRLRSIQATVDATRLLVAEALQLQVEEQGLDERARELGAEIQRLRADQDGSIGAEGQ